MMRKMNKEQDKVLACYDDESNNYDARRFTSRLGKYIDNTERELLLKDIHGRRILELCCGTGRFAELFANTDIRYTGVDFSEKMLEQARQKKLGNAKFACMNVNDISQLPGKYDTIFCIRAVKFWDEPAKTFRDCYGLLSDGGRLVVHFVQRNILSQLMFGSNPFRGIKRRLGIFRGWTRGTGTEKNYSNSEIKQLMQEAGFEIIRKENYFNPLFGLQNLVKSSALLSDFLIQTDKVFRRGWRSVIVGKKLT